MRTGFLLTATVAICGTLGVSAAGVERIGVVNRRQAREAVAEVLAQPEFRRVNDESQTWGEWLMEKLKGLVSWLGDKLWALPAWLSWLIVIWMLLTLVAILAHLVYVVISQIGSGPGRRLEPRRAKGRIYGVHKQNFDAVLAEAHRHIEAGHWVAAVRYFYVAAILWLDRHGKVHFREFKTNHDYIRELTPHAHAQNLFRTLTRSFDLAVYGGQPPTQDTCLAMAAGLESLQCEVGPADKT
jgi:hypothetical protein